MATSSLRFRSARDIDHRGIQILKTSVKRDLGFCQTHSLATNRAPRERPETRRPNLAFVITPSPHAANRRDSKWRLFSSVTSGMQPFAVAPQATLGTVPSRCNISA